MRNLCKRSSLQFVADFETNTTPELLQENPVWLWAYCEISDSPTPVYGCGLDSFFNVIDSMNNADIYFHNLKFDGEFIVYWLLNHGYTYDATPKAPAGTFATLINDMGAWYCVEVLLFNGARVRFKDSLKRIPLKVEQIPRAYGLEECKGVIDYEKPRKAGYKPTDEELDYISHDVSIVARALFMQDAAGMTKITVGSNAFSFFKRIFVNEYLGIKTDRVKEINKGFQEVFPSPSDYEDKFCRAAYLGGWTYANDKYKGLPIEKPGRVYDVNSLYPSVMRFNAFPYGRPVRHGFGEVPEIYKNENYVYFQRVIFCARLKRGCFPILKIKDSTRYLWNRYITDTGISPRTGERCNKYVTATFTNVDLEMLLKLYDVKIIAYDEHIVYRAKKGFFNTYIDYWTEQKINAAKDGNKGLRTIAKLYLNNLYGKFGTNPARASKTPYIGDDGAIRYKVCEDSSQPVYIPVAAFCTAYARRVTVLAAIKAGSRFLYADTDSLHIIGDYDLDIPVDDYKLGYWKLENHFTRAKYLGAKCYAEYINGKWVLTVAGMPLECKQNMDVERDFRIGYVAAGKLVPRHYPGGLILEPTTFEIKER